MASTSGSTNNPYIWDPAWSLTAAYLCLLYAADAVAYSWYYVAIVLLAFTCMHATIASTGTSPSRRAWHRWIACQALIFGVLILLLPENIWSQATRWVLLVSWPLSWIGFVVSQIFRRRKESQSRPIDS